MKLKKYIFMGALGFLLPVIGGFFLKEQVLGVLQVLCYILAVLCFMGCFFHSKGGLFKTICILNALLCLAMGLYELTLLLQQFELPFFSATSFFVYALPYLMPAVIVLFSLAVMLRNKKDMGTVMLSTLTLVAVVLSFYLHLSYLKDLVFSVLLFYFYFTKARP